MQPATRSFAGKFVLLDTRAAWLLRQDEPQEIEIQLFGVSSEAAQIFSQVFGACTAQDSGRSGGSIAIEQPCIEWRQDGAALIISTGGTKRRLAAAEITVHEPLRELYPALPVMQLDPAARRFWRRIFLLLRVPGGRLLLKWFRPKP